jgi:hypothetical protein
MNEAELLALRWLAEDACMLVVYFAFGYVARWLAE